MVSHTVSKCVLLFVLVHVVSATIEEGDLPTEIHDCIQAILNKSHQPITNEKFLEDGHAHCLQTLIWTTGMINGNGFNLSEKETEFINSLARSLLWGRRPRRQVTLSGFVPGTGFRVRREYRRLSDGQRAAFHAALKIMKANGQYDTFANLHRGAIVTSAHGGPNIWGWHRIYLLLFEEALRRIDPTVSLPYWDCSLDYDMDNPVNSIIWSPSFFGNGNGLVMQGPFANWKTSMGTLARKIGGGSRLISKEMIQDILTKCHTREISQPTAESVFCLEIAHGGPHIWVGGHMAVTNATAHDPVFFMFHAFVDYIWEMFRNRQTTRQCNVNPQTDYPPTAGLQSAIRTMDGFPQFRNIDGYLSRWTQLWYRYEQSPVCSMSQPTCGTPYLRCDVQWKRCVSLARNITSHATRKGSTDYVPEEEINLDHIVGPKFLAPPHDPRNKDAQVSLERHRRSGHFTNKTEYNTLSIDHISHNHHFIAPPSDGRTSDVLGKNIAGGVISSDPVLPETVPGMPIFESADPLPLLPNTDFLQSTRNNTPIQNDFKIDGYANVSMWAFVPVKIVYRQLDRFLNSSNENTNKTILNTPNCVQANNASETVIINSNGLNYNGTYTGYVTVNSSLSFDSAVTRIGVKSSQTGATEVIFTAIHSCDRICQPHCRVAGSRVPPEYRPCSGLLSISLNDQGTFGRIFEDEVSLVQKESNLEISELTEDARVVFYCFFDDVVSPWFAFEDKSSP